MKIFLSWSGAVSREFAHAFQELLAQVLPWSQIYLSDDEIESGERWLANITTALDGTSYGILFVTNQNKTAPWLIFEAGALSKNMAESRVVPLLCDIEDVDLTGNPLSQFQYRKLTKNDAERLVKDINAKCDNPVHWDRLSRTFEKFWPDYEPELIRLQEESAKAIKESAGAGKSKSSTRVDLDQLQDSLNEILRTIRTNNRALASDRISVSAKGLMTDSSLVVTEKDFVSPINIEYIEFGDDKYVGEVDIESGRGRLLFKSSGKVAMRYAPGMRGSPDDWRPRFVRTANRIRSGND